MSSFLQSSLSSLGLHAILFGGLCLVPAVSSHRLQVAGAPNVVSIELVSSDVTEPILEDDAIEFPPEEEVPVPVDIQTLTSSDREQIEPLELVEEAKRPVPVKTIAPLVSSIRSSFTQIESVVQQILGSDKVPVDFSKNQPPSYPILAVRARWEGTVVLKLSVNEHGEVIDIEVVASSGYSILDDAAVTAVRTWKGTPARRMGVAVPTEEVLPIRFRL